MIRVARRAWCSRRRTGQCTSGTCRAAAVGNFLEPTRRAATCSITSGTPPCFRPTRAARSASPPGSPTSAIQSRTIVSACLEAWRPAAGRRVECGGTSSCVPRYQQSGVATFRAYLDDGRADAEALLDQGRCAGSSDGVVTAPECAGRRYRTAVHLQLLPQDLAAQLAARLRRRPRRASVAVPRRRGAPGDRRRLPVLRPLRRRRRRASHVRRLRRPRRRCDVDTSSQPWPWPMQRWSPDGHEHVLGTDPTDAKSSGCATSARRRYAAPPCHPPPSCEATRLSAWNSALSSTTRCPT